MLKIFRKILPMFAFLFMVACVQEIPIEELENETFVEEPQNTPVPNPPPAQDITAPKIVSTIPSGMQPSSVTSVVMQVVTDEIASCNYDLSDKDFDQMLNALPSTDGGRTHARAIAVLEDTNYLFYVRCRDSFNNKMVTSTLINFSIEKKGVEDKVAPLISNISPSGELVAGTRSANLSLTSSEASVCKYSANGSATFDQMLSMNSTNGMNHLVPVNSLMDGASYSYYFYCKDLAGNLSVKGSTSFSIKVLELDGAKLYAANCMGCHNPLQNSNKQNNSASDIKSAIQGVSQMRLAYLQALTDTQLQAIADVLKVTPPADTTAPVISMLLPSGTQPSTTQSVTLQLMTNESASCRYSNQDQSFDQMGEVLTASGGGLSHSKVVAVQMDTNYRFFIRCQDASQNKNLSSSIISFYIDKVADITAPVISSINPSSDLPAGTKSANLSLATNESSTCRYSTNTNANYEQMMAMSSSGGILHSVSLNNLIDGATYSYYFYCKDSAGNQSQKAQTSFKVAVPNLDGASLYASNCMNCHGALASSGKKGASAIGIQDAINNVGTMRNKPYLTALTFAQIEAIAEALKIQPTNKPQVSFLASSSAIGEEKALAVVGVKLSAPATQSITVQYYVSGGTATKDSDYGFFDGQLVFNVGESQKSFTIALLDDQDMESNETIILSLRNAVNADIVNPSQHTLSIMDNDSSNGVQATFQDFAGLLTSQQCMSCHDMPGYGNFAILTDINNPISSEQAWIQAKSNDGSRQYIVPGKPEESYILERWRKVHDDGSVSGNMPAGAFSNLRLSVDQRKMLEAYITNIKVDNSAGEVSNALPNFISANLGDATGSKAISGNKRTLTVSSSDLYQAQDNHFYDYVRVYGNFELSAKINVLQNNHQWAKAGLVIKNKVSEPDYRLQTDFLSLQGSVVTQHTGLGANYFNKVDNLPGPLYVKISRIGDTISIYTKQSLMEAWTRIENLQLTMSPLSYIGFSVSSWERVNTVVAEYSEISFNGTVVGDTNLSDAEIIDAIQNNRADFAKKHSVAEEAFDISMIDPSKKFERFNAVMQTYCISCHNGSDPVARNFGSRNTEEEWLAFRDLSGANLAIVKGSSIDSYLFKFLKHNQLVGTPASMPKAGAYKAEYTQYVADWINSFAIEEGTIAQNCQDVDSLPEPARIRRVSRTEYNNFINELFGLTEDYASQIPVGSIYMGYNKTGEAGILADKIYYDRIQSSAQSVISDLFNGQGNLTEKFNCSEASSDTCHLNYLNRIAQHAFRKSLDQDHRSNLVAIFNKSKELGLGKIEGTKAGLEYILTQPEFNLVMNFDGNLASLRNLSNSELLEQISLFLWTSLPDENDLNQVVSGSLNLQNDLVLESFIEKMLNDDRASNFVDDFVGQWLELDKLDNFVSSKYPNIDQIKDSMKLESKYLFDYILKNDRPFTEILNANYTFIDSKLASHYGFNFNVGNTFDRYTYQAQDKRNGILSHASFLAINSSGVDSKPTTRGKFVIERLMCGELFDLPGGGVDPVQVDPATPFRQTVIDHSKDSSCAGCHQIMDPIGLGLENFDTAGIYRTNYDSNKNNQPIDSRGALYLEEFNSVSELNEIIKKQNAFNKCLTEHLMIFGTGMQLNTKHKVADKCSVETISQDTINTNLSLKELIKKIILSDSFRKRDLR